MEQSHYAIRIAPHRCAGCCRCVRACSCGAIVIRNQQAAIVQEKCIRCGACRKACPHGMISLRDDVESVRRLLLCSGPPFTETNDRLLAERIREWDGTTVICGGTTAAIVARELRREIEVNLRRDISGLPPTSSMPGVELITEGVLTLARVKSLLEQTSSAELKGQGTDFELARMLLEHDRIEFVIGTRINPQHQDPTLPVELELRQNVVKEIARLLESKFLKEIRIEYL